MKIGRYTEMIRLELRGLRAAPSQVWGSVRLVPLVREQVRADLRVDPRVYGGFGHVSLRGGTRYTSFIPHGLVFNWSEDGSPAAAMGTWVGSSEGRVFDKHGIIRSFQRMVRREGPERSVRLLPLHLAMEGFMALGFAGPDIAWKDYSTKVLRHGLSPREESALSGWAVPGLADALRLFEIHEDQCGVLIFVGDAFASAMVMPHPEDYRLLHPSLIQDFYAEILWHYGLLYREVPSWRVALEGPIADFAGLARALEEATRSWASFDASMATGLLDRDVPSERCFSAGPFTLRRFLTGLTPGQENHLGELMQDGGGELMYLRSYRLSEAQVKRGYLLWQLMEADWNLDALSTRLGCSREELKRRVENAGFSGMFAQPAHR